MAEERKDAIEHVDESNGQGSDDILGQYERAVAEYERLRPLAGPGQLLRARMTILLGRAMVRTGRALQSLATRERKFSMRHILKDAAAWSLLFYLICNRGKSWDTRLLLGIFVGCTVVSFAYDLRDHVRRNRARFSVVPRFAIETAMVLILAVLVYGLAYTLTYEALAFKTLLLAVGIFGIGIALDVLGCTYHPDIPGRMDARERWYTWHIAVITVWFGTAIILFFNGQRSNQHIQISIGILMILLGIVYALLQAGGLRSNAIRRREKGRNKDMHGMDS